MVKILLIFFTLLSPSSSGTSQSEIIQHFKFSTDVGQIAKDKSSNNLDAVSGTRLIAQEEDVIFTTRGVYFGASSQLNYPPNVISNNFLPIQSTMTFSAFVAIQSDEAKIVEIVNQSGSINGFIVKFSQTQLSCITYSITENWVQTTEYIKPNQWYHISCSLIWDQETGGSLYVAVNDHITQTTYTSQFPFIQYTKYLSTPGSGTSFFVYELKVQDVGYTSPLQVNYSCSSCQVCPTTGICIPEQFNPNYNDLSVSCNCDKNSCDNEGVCIECKSNCNGLCNSQDYSECIDLQETYCKQQIAEVIQCNWSFNCITGCDRCENYQQCVRCSKTYFLLEDTKQCSSDSCPTAYYNAGSHYEYEECHICPANCENCEGEDQCTSCADQNAEISLTGTSTLCVCKSGYYEVQNAPIVCELCHSSCSTCTGAGNSKCTSCTDVLTTMNSALWPGYCECPSGTIQVQSSPLNCENCPQNCETCDQNLECTQCDPGYYNNDGDCWNCSNGCKTCSEFSVCESCEEGYYLEGVRCQQCDRYCKVCKEQGQCEQCEYSFELNKEGICECGSFHILNQTLVQCQYQILQATLSLGDQSIIINFNLPLKQNLSTKNIKNSYFIPGYQNVQLKIQKDSDTLYQAIIDNRGKYPDNIWAIRIDFTGLQGQNGTQMLHSQYRINIDIETLQSYDQAQQEEQELTKAEQIEQEVKQAAGPVVSTGLGSSAIIQSMATQNPSMIWTFVNAAQILFYIPAQNIDFPDHLVTLYAAFGGSFIPIPSLGVLVYGEEDGFTQTPSNWHDLEITSTNFLVNSGQVIMVGLIALTYFPIFGVLYLIFRKQKKLQKYFRGKLQDIRWNFFIRFWLQGYVIVMSSCLLQIGVVIFSQVSEEGVGVWVVVSVFFLFMGFLSILFFVWFVQRNMMRINQKDKLLLKRTGSIYEEFKINKGLLPLCYQSVFCLQRLVYVFILYFLSNFPLFQVFLNVGHALVLVFYLIYYSPFADKDINKLNIAFQILVAFHFFISGFFLLDLTEEQQDALYWILIVSLLFVLGISYLYSMKEAMKSVKKFFKKRRKRKVDTDKRLQELDNLDQKSLSRKYENGKKLLYEQNLEKPDKQNKMKVVKKGQFLDIENFGLFSERNQELEISDFETRRVDESSRNPIPNVQDMQVEELDSENSLEIGNLGNREFE